MIIYLGGCNRPPLFEVISDDIWNRVNGLLSFELLKKGDAENIPRMRRFMLDSGAFSFIIRKLKSKNENKEINWDEYLDNYCEFIKQNKVDQFFELDVDFLVGYDKVKEFRKQIIQKTERLPIPVWHISRGKKDFEEMCDEFPYVALGGMISKENNTSVDLELMVWLVNEAHKRGTKIHGLGFTKTPLLPYIHFDSVDSTSYLQSAVRGGLVYMDENNELRCLKVRRSLDLSDRDFVVNNFLEWTKYCKYAESHF